MTHGTTEPRDDQASPSRDEYHRDLGRRVERLLGEIEAMAGPSAWSKIEELLRSLLELHREAFSRVLDMAASGDAENALPSRMGADELVSSLLLLHGLHPDPAPDRIRRGLDEMRPHLESCGGAVEFLGLSETGAARLRVVGAELGSAAPAIERAVRRTVEEAAPEVVRIEIEMPGTPRAPRDLVQLGLRKPEKRP